MNITESALIEILRAFATDSQPKLNTDSVDFEELFGLAKKHSVIGIVAYMLNKYGCFLQEEMQKKYMHEYDRTIMQMSSREFSAAQIIAMLNSNSIPHITFKGMKVSEAYPIAELRTYGDVDIIIRKQDVKRVCEIMSARGFAHSIADAGVVNEFKKNRERYEFHINLNVSNLTDDSFFSKVWENSVNTGECTHQFTHEFHLSYLITHLEKHVYGSGAGLRMYLDIALYIKKYADKMNLDAVRENLVSCGLGKFLDTVMYVCNKWFDMELPLWVTPLSDDVYGRMCEFTFTGGVFGEQGQTRKNEDSVRREMEKGNKAIKFRLFVHRMFPSFYELCRLYPKYNGKPFLAPFAWIRHIFDSVRKKKISKVKDIVSVNIQAATMQKEFLNSIGSSRGK